MRILIIEDDPTSSAILEKLLTPYGKCVVTTNGLEGLEEFKQAHAEDRPYDLICLDLMMPRMDGHRVLELIRQSEDRRYVSPERRVKIIMTTSSADRKNVMRAGQSGCDAYLIKPVQHEVLRKTLENLRFTPAGERGSEAGVKIIG